jgi:hypothetical protein
MKAWFNPVSAPANNYSVYGCPPNISLGSSINSTKKPDQSTQIDFTFTSGGQRWS